MSDEEKALELSSGSSTKDNSSLKSRDSNAFEAGDVHHDAQNGLRKRHVDAGTQYDRDASRRNSQYARSKDSHGDPNLVEWDGDNDPENPMNWSFGRKVYMSIMASFLTFAVGFSSSVFSADIRVTAKEFNVSEEVMVLGVSLYVLGFACGTLHPLYSSLN